MAQEPAEVYADFSDEELAALAARDKSALTALMIRCDLFISAKAETMKTADIAADDLFQEGIMGLLDAVKSFDEGKGASFRTFANICVRNRMLGTVSKRSSHISLEDAEISRAGGSSESPESIVVRQEHEKMLFESIEHKLTAAEWNVLRLYLSGYSYRAIAQELRITVKSADNAMQRVRRKLKAILRK